MNGNYVHYIVTYNCYNHNTRTEGRCNCEANVKLISVYCGKPPTQMKTHSVIMMRSHSNTRLCSSNNSLA